MQATLAPSIVVYTRRLLQNVTFFIGLQGGFVKDALISKILNLDLCSCMPHYLVWKNLQKHVTILHFKYHFTIFLQKFYLDPTAVGWVAYGSIVVTWEKN